MTDDRLHAAPRPAHAGGAITLAYDPLMRLYQASTARWAYDGQEMIAEYNTNNTLLRRFVHGPGVDEPLVWYEGGSTTNRRFLHADERGSIIAISDGSGAVIGTNTYDEYGVPTSPTMGRFQYTGQAWSGTMEQKRRTTSGSTLGGLALCPGFS